ncbi:MAG: hypothetical protein IPJ31_12650 [Bacteroidetes bacterium]|nr:hypothetical protein [Bacteroidota bacterium]
MKVKQQIQQTFIGIDVSKLTLDVSIITVDGYQQHEQFENNAKGFKKLHTCYIQQIYLATKLHCSAWNIPAFIHGSSYNF